jgi:Co/Zn/Cd efflux system component
MDQRLAIVGAIVLAYAISEIVLGLQMRSITLTTDGFHNMGDAGGFVLALIISAVRAREPDRTKADRIALTGGFANASIVLVLTFCAGVEAVISFFSSAYPDLGVMYFVCAASGCFIKAFGALFLGGLEVNFSGIHDHDHSHAHGYETCPGHRCVPLGRLFRAVLWDALTGLVVLQ